MQSSACEVYLFQKKKNVVFIDFNSLNRLNRLSRRPVDRSIDLVMEHWIRNDRSRREHSVRASCQVFWSSLVLSTHILILLILMWPGLSPYQCVFIVLYGPLDSFGNAFLVYSGIVGRVHNEHQHNEAHPPRALEHCTFSGLLIFSPCFVFHKSFDSIDSRAANLFAASVGIFRALCVVWSAGLCILCIFGGCWSCTSWTWVAPHT